MEFDSEHDGTETECPHCGQPIKLISPPALRPPKINPVLITLGDIAITADTVITPNGSFPLANAQWVFSDVSRVDTKIPAIAIILAIVFALLCLLGLLFLLMKETIVRGYVEISVHGPGVFYKTQIPVTSTYQVDMLRAEFNKVQGITGTARSLR